MGDLGRGEILQTIAGAKDVIAALQVQPVRLRVGSRRPGHGPPFFVRQRGGQGIGDHLGDIALHPERIIHLAVIALCPDVVVRTGVDQSGSRHGCACQW